MINLMGSHLNNSAILKTLGLDSVIEEFWVICYKQIRKYVMQMFMLKHENKYLGFFDKQKKCKSSEL